MVNRQHRGYISLMAAAERALARARAALAAIDGDSAEVGTPPPRAAAYEYDGPQRSGRGRLPLAVASPRRLGSATYLRQQQQPPPPPPPQEEVDLVSSIRNAQLELSALSASNADWANAARQLLQQPALAHEPAVGQLLARQHELWAQLDPALPPLALSPPAAGEAAPAAPAAPAQRTQAESSESQVPPAVLVSSSSQAAGRDRSKGAAPPAAAVQADRAVVCGGEDSVEPGPAPQATAGADGAAGGADRTVLLRRWRRWLSHLQRRVETRLLRAAMYGWRLAAVSLSVRRQATLRVCEQHRARADDAAKREALRLWRSAEEHRAQWRNAQAAGVARLHRRRRAKWLGALVGGWRRLASRSVLQRQLALAQAMQSAAEEGSSVERSLRLAAEAELQALRGQLASSRRELDVHLAPERERSRGLRERVQALEAEVVAGAEREEEGQRLLREALAARQDAMLEMTAAVARAGSSREAELARQAELATSNRLLAAATKTLEACERNGLVRRTARGAIEVREIPVGAAATATLEAD